jgi:hypothetical protein
MIVQCRWRAVPDSLSVMSNAWGAVHPRDRRLSEVDGRLHHERTRGAHPPTACAELPYGAMVSLAGSAWVVVNNGLRAH